MILQSLKKNRIMFSSALMSLQIRKVSLFAFLGWVLITIYLLATHPGNDTVGGDLQKAKVIFVLSSDQNDGSFVFTEIFKRNTDHFMYFDDPLRGITENIRDINSDSHFDQANYNAEMELFLEEIAVCRYTEQSDRYLKYLGLPYSSSPSSKYIVSLKSDCQPGDKACGVLTSSLMNRVCQENRFKHHVIKLPRSHFRNMGSLAKIMDIKIPKITKREIYYLDFVRDPRALIYAQIKSEANFLNSMDYFLRDFCKDLTPIPVRFRHNLITLRYEDLSHSAANLVKFLGLPPALENSFDRYLRSVTAPLQGKTPVKFDVIRKRNFDAKVRNWRKYIDFKVMTTIQKQCKDVLRLYSYTSFWTEEKLRNVK